MATHHIGSEPFRDGARPRLSNGSAFWGEIAGETQERKPPFRQNIGYEESCSLILTATPRFIRVLMEATFRQFTR